MTVKIRTISYVVIVSLLLSACDEVDDLLTFFITDQTTFTVDSASPLNLPFEISTPDIATNSEQKFQNNNTKASLVKDVKLSELKLTITDPSDKTFSFLKSIHLYISTNGSNEIELAYLDNVPSDAKTITLIPTQQKLDEYVKASSYKLRTRLVTRETLTQSIDIRTDLKFRVTAAPL